MFAKCLTDHLDCHGVNGCQRAAQHTPSTLAFLCLVFDPFLPIADQAHLRFVGNSAPAQLVELVRHPRTWRAGTALDISPPFAFLLRSPSTLNARDLVVLGGRLACDEGLDEG